MKPYIKKVPKPLKYCEELFDKDVLEIKQLVKGIGDLKNLIRKTLQLEDILAPKKIETEDSKITNISILSVAESKMQIVHEFLIEGLQKFQQ